MQWKRFNAAKLIETAILVAVYGIPAGIAEWNTSWPWWIVALSRLFNAALNSWTLLYCTALGYWIASHFPTFSRLLRFSGTGRQKVGTLAAILLMQLPANYLFVLLLNTVLPEGEQAIVGPLAIAVGGGLGMWLWLTWLCPYFERHIAWLNRLARDPVGTTRTAAQQVVAGGRRLVTGSKSR